MNRLPSQPDPGREGDGPPARAVGPFHGLRARLAPAGRAIEARLGWHTGGGAIGRPTLLAAAVSVGGVLVLALAAAAVRLLPWVFDATVPWRVVVPFARALAVVALEAALLVGWPLGAALAVARFVDRGEERVYALLGEPPTRTVGRILPQSVGCALLLAFASFLGGRDARAPGHVLDDLLREGHAACLTARGPEALTVPFLDAAWLCRPDAEPRLLAESPVGGLLVSARDAHVTDDLRRIDLDDARFDLGPRLDASHALHVASPRATAPVRVRVGHLALSGLPPWARASVLPPAARSALVALSGLASALLSAYLLLRRRLRTRFAAVVYGVAGPVAALGALRGLERLPGVAPAWFILLPFAAAGAIATVDAVRAAFAALVLRLPPRWPAAS